MVSVIVPNYNHARFLDERLQSILNQTYQNFELIILDDCSTDNSREIIYKYIENSHVSHVVFNENNSGTPFKQWRRGISLAKGEWIWIAESDDIADLSFLEVLMCDAENNPSCGLIYSQLRWVDEKSNYMFGGEEIDDRFYKGEFFLRYKLLFSTTIFNVSSCIFRRSYYEMINSDLYQSFRKVGDYMFYVQMSEVCDVYESGKCLCSFRCVNSSVSHHPADFINVDEGLMVLDYITSIINVFQYKYIIYNIRCLYRYKLSFRGNVLAMLKYLKHGYWLFFLYPLYCLKKCIGL